MTDEIWKPISGYEGVYEVSDLGRVRSCDRIVEDDYCGKRRFRSRVLRQSQNHSGYCQVVLSKNNKLKTFIGKDGLIDVDTFSKTLNIKELGRNNMYKWLRENKYLMRNNKPYQHYINQGLFKLKSVGYRTNCVGEQIPLFKTYISIKGCGYLLDKLVNQGYIDFVKDFQNN